MAVKQTFSEEESEPLKTASFPRDSEVPLDPFLYGGEVHTEPSLHGIYQVLDSAQISFCTAATPYIKCLKDKDLSQKNGPWWLSSSHPPQPLQNTGRTPKIGIQCYFQPGHCFQKPPRPAPLAHATSTSSSTCWNYKHSLSFLHQISVLFFPILVNGIDDQLASPIDPQ